MAAIDRYLEQVMRDRIPMRNDPFGVARVRRGLNLTRGALGRMLGLGATPEEADASIRAVERGEQAITPSMSKLLADLEIAMPGDMDMHPRFLIGEATPKLDEFVVHTRFPRFYGRIVPTGTPVTQMIEAPISQTEKLVVYLWQDAPDCTSQAQIQSVLDDAVAFVRDYQTKYESMDAEFEPWGYGELTF